MTERRRIILLAVVLAILGAVLVSRAQAHTAIRWEQPDYEPGDRWEVLWGPCSVPGGWVALEPSWGGDSVWGALMEPEADCTAVARTWRDGEVSVDSAPHIYVPEPPRWMLLAAGVGGLALLGAPRRVIRGERASPARAGRLSSARR